MSMSNLFYIGLSTRIKLLNSLVCSMILEKESLIYHLIQVPGLKAGLVYMTS